MNAEVKYPNVHTYVDRHGKARAYFRRKGMPRIPLRNPVGTAGFLAEYRSIMRGEPQPTIPRAAPRKKPKQHAPIVYFARAGSRIKIGTTTNLPSRLAYLQTASSERVIVLLKVPGGREIERQYHAKFKSHKMRGEWFSPAPELTKYIAEERTRRRQGMAIRQKG